MDTSYDHARILLGEKVWLDTQSTQEGCSISAILTVLQSPPTYPAPAYDLARHGMGGGIKHSQHMVEKMYRKHLREVLFGARHAELIELHPAMEGMPDEWVAAALNLQ